MSNKRVRGFVLILVLAMVVSACGGSDDTLEADPTETADDPGVATDGSDASNNDDDEENDENDDATDSGDEPQTLDDYLGGTGFFTLDPEELAANYARLEQQVQELIAQCMARQGFEYIPATPPVDDSEFGAPSDVEHARDFGFGISTLFDETESPSRDDDWVDPNKEIVESLAESERNAYNETLHGSTFSSGGLSFDGDSAASASDADGPTEVEGADDGFEGCNGQAYSEVYAFEERQELFEQLDLESLFQRVEADPRTAESYAEWSECMAERGYDYENFDALIDTVYGDLQARFDEIVGSAGGFVDPFEGMSREEIDEIFSSLSPEELDDFFAQAEQTARADIDQEALTALQTEERALAVANAECSEGVYEQFDELYREYEAALVDENRTLLEQFRDGREG